MSETKHTVAAWLHDLQLNVGRSWPVRSRLLEGGKHNRTFGVIDA